MNKLLKIDNVKNLDDLIKYLERIHKLMCSNYKLETSLIFSKEESDFEGISNEKEIIIYIKDTVFEEQLVNIIDTYFHELKHVITYNSKNSFYRELILIMEECIICNDHDNRMYTSRHDTFMDEIEAIEYAHLNTLEIIENSNIHLTKEMVEILIFDNLRTIKTNFFKETFYLKNLINKFNYVISKDIKNKEYYLENLTILYDMDGNPRSIDWIINHPGFDILFNNNKEIFFSFFMSKYFFKTYNEEVATEKVKKIMTEALKYDEINEKMIEEIENKFSVEHPIYLMYIRNFLDDFCEDKPKTYYIKKLRIWNIHKRIIKFFKSAK